MNKWTLRDELMWAGYSFGEATRLILNGNVSINEVKCKKPKQEVIDGNLIWVDKRNKVIRLTNGRKVKPKSQHESWVSRYI